MIRRVVLAVVLIAAFIGGCRSQPALPSPSPAPASVTMRLTDYLDGLARDQQFRGAVEVQRADRVLLSRGFGDADVAKGVANGPQTRFRINSLTKQFTALAILKLQELGKLHTSDPVCAHLPHCPTAWSMITIEHALTHTAGLFNYTELSDADAAAYFAKIRTTRPTPEQLLGAFADRPLEFTPGAQWRYSNSGYAVLGYLIEQVTGQDYGTILRQEILEPLGMADSGFPPDPADQHPTAIGYDDATTPTDPRAPLLEPAIAYAAGGMYATTTDLARWNHFLLTGTPPIVTKDTLTQFLQPRVKIDAVYQYGFGLQITGIPDNPSYFHSGAGPGFTSYTEIHPATGLSVIVLSNLGTANADNIGHTLTSLTE